MRLCRQTFSVRRTAVHKIVRLGLGSGHRLQEKPIHLLVGVCHGKRRYNPELVSSELFLIYFGLMFSAVPEAERDAITVIVFIATFFVSLGFGRFLKRRAGVRLACCSGSSV